MASLMFVTMDGGGNVPPLLEIARRCQTGGHDVMVCGHERLASKFQDEHLAFTPFTHARQWDARVPQSSIDWLRMFNDAGIGTDVASAYRRHRPDLTIVDCMLISAHQALADAGARRVVLTHTVRAYLDGLWQTGVGSASRFYGHDVKVLWNTAALNLVVGYPPLDEASRRPQPSNVQWTGAITGPASPAVPTNPHRVLVSLSTNDFRGMRSSLQRIIDALGGLPVTATVTTGGVYEPSEFTSPANVYVENYVDHGEIMRTCSMVIGHGGYSTTVRALAHGLPLVLLPANAVSDQPLVSRAVARLGAGTKLRRRASGAAIANAVEDVLQNPRHSENAARIGAEIRATDGAAHAERAIIAAID